MTAITRKQIFDASKSPYEKFLDRVQKVISHLTKRHPGGGNQNLIDEAAEMMVAAYEKSGCPATALYEEYDMETGTPASYCMRIGTVGGMRFSEEYDTFLQEMEDWLINETTRLKHCSTNDKHQMAFAWELEKARRTSQGIEIIAFTRPALRAMIALAEDKDTQPKLNIAHGSQERASQISLEQINVIFADRPKMDALITQMTNQSGNFSRKVVFSEDPPRSRHHHLIDCHGIVSLRWNAERCDFNGQDIYVRDHKLAETLLQALPGSPLDKLIEAPITHGLGLTITGANNFGASLQLETDEEQEDKLLIYRK